MSLVNTFHFDVQIIDFNTVVVSYHLSRVCCTLRRMMASGKFVRAQFVEKQVKKKDGKIKVFWIF